MIEKEPDSVTVFFQDPTNIKRLSMSQVNRLDNILADIDKLRAKEPSDDVEIGKLRSQMAGVIEEVSSNNATSDAVPTSDDAEPGRARHMSNKKSRFFG